MPQTGGASATDMGFSQFWKLEVQDQGAGRLRVWWEPTSWLKEGCLLSVSSQGRRHKGSLWNLACKGADPVHGAPPSGSKLLPKAPPPDVITLRIRFQHMNSGAGHRHLVYCTGEGVLVFSASPAAGAAGVTPCLSPRSEGGKFPGHRKGGQTLGSQKKKDKCARKSHL